MATPNGSAKDGEQFGFPYAPYSIQLDLMRAIHGAIEERRVAILESPTGTGKSLSAICASLSWLTENERREREEAAQREQQLQQAKKDAADEKDWMAAHKRKMAAEEELEQLREKQEERAKIDEKLAQARQRQRMAKGTNQQQKRKKHCEAKEGEEGNELFALESWEERPKEEEDEDLIPSDPEEEATNENVSPAVRVRGETAADGQEQAPPPLQCCKVIYASRTHSQLEQFAHELAKTGFRPRVLTLGSRQMLCVNDAVRALGTPGLVNDRCNELLSGLKESTATAGEKRARGANSEQVVLKSASKKCGCEFARAEAIEELSDALLAASATLPGAGREQREVVALGRHQRACPYLAIRAAQPLCELVLAPYNIVLHERTRGAWKLDLGGNVLIVDEAHNLLQTLADIHAVELSGAQLAASSALLADYIGRFRTRLSARNLRHIRQLQSLAQALHRLVSATASHQQATRRETVLTLPQLLVQLGSCADIDLFGLLRYLEASRLCRKLRDFRLRHPQGSVVQSPSSEASPKTTAFATLMERMKGAGKEANAKAARMAAVSTPAAVNPPTGRRPPSSTPLYQLREFIEAITSRAEDARILITTTAQPTGGGSSAPQIGEASLRFVLLNPAARLQQLVAETRALVLLGGTMRPVDQLLDALRRVCGVPEQRILQFSCGHVIDDSQLIALQIGTGPDGCALNLQFSNRESQRLLCSIAQSMVNLLRHVPHGAVAFFPSHAFLAQFLQAIRSSGHFAQLDRVKRVFIEARTPESAETVWKSFCEAARAQRQGAVLFAVVGGRLSEGINFSDELGRCVIMVGVPYANRHSAELGERMRYLDQTIGAGAGDRFYEQLCLQSVNQAIGRAIRHRADHAAIVLLDERYARPAIEQGLPGWIRQRLARTARFPDALQRLIAFFRAHN